MKQQERTEAVLPPAEETITGRHHHYGEFYRLKHVNSPEDSAHLPRVAVVGNCQAESLRILLDSSGAVSSYRIPPVHEWTADDMRYVGATLAQTDVLISQPIRDNYRDLPSGTQQLTQLLPQDARVIKFPVLRFNGLNPAIAIVRSPQDPSLNPPVVPYHDLTLIAEVAGIEKTRPVDYLACAQQSIRQLASREDAHGCVRISDVLAHNPVWHILNHPDNSTLTTLAQRVLKAIDPQISDAAVSAVGADHELLGNLQSPIDPHAAAFFEINEHRDQWTLNGEVIPEDKIRTEQLAFYKKHPEIIDAALTRHRALLSYLGYDVPALPQESNK